MQDIAGLLLVAVCFAAMHRASVPQVEGSLQSFINGSFENIQNIEDALALLKKFQARDVVSPFGPRAHHLMCLDMCVARVYKSNLAGVTILFCICICICFHNCIVYFYLYLGLVAMPFVAFSVCDW